ncbi:MAG: amino acid permease [Myxococcota bacterium]
MAQLKRQLNTWDASARCMSASSWAQGFFAPGQIHRGRARIGAAIALWILGGIIAGCGALCYAECGARLPKVWRILRLLSRGFGEAVAFSGGFSALSVTYPASVAAIALIFGHYLTELLPWAVSTEHPPIAIIACAINVLLAFEPGRGQRLMTLLKVLCISCVCLAAWIASDSQIPPASSLFAGLFATQGGILGALTALVAHPLDLQWLV